MRPSHHDFGTEAAPQELLASTHEGDEDIAEPAPQCVDMGPAMRSIVVGRRRLPPKG